MILYGVLNWVSYNKKFLWDVAFSINSDKGVQFFVIFLETNISQTFPNVNIHTQLAAVVEFSYLSWYTN